MPGTVLPSTLRGGVQPGRHIGPPLSRSDGRFQAQHLARSDQSPRDFVGFAPGFNLASNVATTHSTFAVVIPALNEEAAIAGLVAEIFTAAQDPHLGAGLQAIYVVDNGSTDRTAERAANAGAIVVPEPRRGYGRACLTGVEAAAGADLIVLMDGDRSDQPADLPLILAPLLDGQADLVIGSRTLGTYEPGSLLPQQRAGNWIAARLLHLLYGVRVTDIGPFRVIRRDHLLGFEMREMTYGWSVEMIARASRSRLRIREVPVSYRNRAGGESKVSGNLQASIRAGYRITSAILRCRWR